MLLSTALRPRLLRRVYVCKSCLRHLSKVQGKVDRKKLPDGPARTRFAPSPTGYLHLGSLRTALYNYLLAKRTGGQFLLRLEDTDTKRTVPGAAERLYEDLRWAGLQWDEGPDIGGPYGPYKQSERTMLYQEHAHKLLESGHGYRCFCTAERLNDLAKQRAQLGLPTDYDRTCANIPKEESDEKASKAEKHVVRLRSPDTYPQFVDIVYGIVGRTQNLGRRADDAFEDPILLKSDGMPTYHLANVVDDHLMKITHVIRGTEWLIATPKHMAMYNAFGWEPPAFAHVGLLTNADGHKLSKRDFDTDIASFKNETLPEALTNFVALLGWSHGSRSDVLALDGLANEFSVKFTKGNTIVNLEKLSFLQRKHSTRLLEQGDNEYFLDVTSRIIAKLNPQDQHSISWNAATLGGCSLRNRVEQVLKADARNYITVEDFIDRNAGFFKECEGSHDVAFSYRKYGPISQDALKLSSVPQSQWNADTVSTQLKKIVESIRDDTSHWNKNYRPKLDEQEPDKLRREKMINKDFHDYLRFALLGGKRGPGTAMSMGILGRDITMKRLERVNYLRKIFEGDLDPVSKERDQDLERTSAGSNR